MAWNEHNQWLDAQIKKEITMPSQQKHSIGTHNAIKNRWHNQWLNAHIQNATLNGDMTVKTANEWTRWLKTVLANHVT